MEYGDPDCGMGGRLRSRREALGLTRGGLVRRLGMTARQLEDYEAGRVRPNAGMLFKLSRELNVPVSYFFARGDGHDSSGKSAEEAPDASHPGGPFSGYGGAYGGYTSTDCDGGARNMRAFAAPSHGGQGMLHGQEDLDAGEIATLLRAYRMLPAPLRASVRDLALRLARQARGGLGFSDGSRG